MGLGQEPVETRIRLVRLELGHASFRGPRLLAGSARAGTPSSDAWITLFAGGLANRNLDGIRSIGVDELAWKKRHKYLTLVYQLDHGRRRLLHTFRWTANGAHQDAQASAQATNESSS